eukprot:6130523-Prorocentrum_lima.AAC.1
MTSSLVGSEMCIRDRRCSVARDGICREAVFGGRWSFVFALKMEHETSPCLLYTSDAADDM